MNESEPSSFPHGAEWVCADFHLHTIKEPGASRKDYRREFSGRENEFPKAWIAKLKSEGVRIAVVTNHNYFDREEYKVLRRLGNKEGILVLPGVELGVKEGGGGIHMLIVFDPKDWVFNEQNDDGIKRFIDSQFTGVPDEGSRSKDDLCGCFEALDGYGKGASHDYFVVFAHVDGDNGLCKELDGGHLEHVIKSCGKRWRERVLGLQKLKSPAVLQRRWPQDVPMPALVEGSDPNSLSEVGSGSRRCFLKVGELSYGSVKFALHDWAQRVTAEISLEKTVPALREVSFIGGLLDGEVFTLSSQLSCLVGSRGSGKSSVIECLRYALGLNAGESDFKYKESLVAAMLANGGEIHVSGVNPDGYAFEVRRAPGYEPVVKLEGKDTRLKPADVLPGLLYFGQKDLGYRHASFEDDLFSKFIGRRTVEERGLEETKITAVKDAVENWRSVVRASEKEQEYAQEEERLRHQLAVYREKGVEKQLESMTKFDADKRELMDFIGDLQKFRYQMELPKDEWDTIEKDWVFLKSELLTEAALAIADIKAAFIGVRENHEALLSRFDTLLDGLRETLKVVLEKERELQEQFSAMQREIDAPGLNLQEFRDRKAKHEQLVKLLKAAGNRKEMGDLAMQQVSESARSLHELWRKWHRDEQTQLNEKKAPLPESLDLSSQFEGNREEFKSFLRGKFSGSGFRAISLDKLVEEFSNGFALFQRRTKVDELLGGSADVAKCNALLMEHLAEILIYRVPDQRMITFNGISIQDLSLGQRATALLQLLMALEGHPLFLIDQPEDDLDNETIFRHVVEPLLKAKTRSQFVIATHNPNIPVLGDAELVHSCREEVKGRYVHDSGSLDSATTRDAIVSIMEGGARAFEQRQKIYSQWTNSL